MMRKSTLLLVLTALLSTFTVANGRQYWAPIHPGLIKSSGKQIIFPNHFKSFVLQTNAMRNTLFALREGPTHATIIELPTPDGSYRTFRIWKSDMMEPPLAAKYADIKTFTAEATDNRQVTAKIDMSPLGFHAMIYDGNTTYFIDPFSDIEDGNYLCYYRKDVTRTSGATCSVVETGQAEILEAAEHNTAMRTHGTERRNYRLALACTYEYAGAVGGITPTKSSVLAQMVLIMNRVNGVYEREFAATMTLVANTDTLIYLTATDPYSNYNGGAMLSQNIATVDDLIGNANYDIGHVFSTGGGGVAYLGVLCDNTYKGGGVTGLSNPVGDPFAIDYVAHEMGHQFGSDHTFNSDLGACSGNGAPALAFEPGSGSTIMAYAGICGTDDLQNNSDAYFHAASLRVIGEYITTGTGSTCPTVTTSTNVPNTYPDFTQTYSIPVWTPFELTAPAVTDNTVDTLNYCWEEWDLGGFPSEWDANNNLMPYFRSFLPNPSPVRVFPIMDHILAGNYFYRGERLPQAARTLNFILTTRDIYEGWGSFNSSYDTDTITLNAVATTDTFQVTSQATTETWSTGSSQTITWDVAGTTAAPINATDVNIYLSVDSGKTFPYLLASGVPNNGTASIVVPAAITQATTTARVKVKGANNVFFQVNRSNININVIPLPVSLTSFKATTGACETILSWTTGEAVGFRHFELQRSSEGSSFETITIRNSNNSNTYSYTDKQQSNGHYFYRLKMVDQDGKAEYSSVITINLACSVASNVAVFPNPTKDNVTISSNNAIKEIVIIAYNGQVVYKQNITGNEVQLAMGAFAQGLYLVQVINNNGSRSVIKLTKE